VGVSTEDALRSSTPPLRGVHRDDWTELLAHGRRRGTLTAEEIVDVLHDVDLTPDAIDTVRLAIVGAGIEVDQSFEVDDSGELRRPFLETDAERSARRGSAGSRRRATRASTSDGRSEGSEQDSLRLYLYEISRIPLLDAEGERRLARLVERGIESRRRLDEGSEQMTFVERRQAKRDVDAGERARQDLITANLRLVVSIAKRFVRPTMPLADAIQSGNIGLMKAVERFDHSRGFKFSTYATWWIRQAISRAVADESRNIRLPAHTVERIGRIRRAERDLTAELRREPTVAEVAARLGDHPDRVAELLELARDTTSLDQPARDDSDLTHADRLVSETDTDPSDSIERDLLREAVRLAIADLPEREQAVMSMRFGLDGVEGATLEEVGRRFDITRERVRQIEVRTLARLRHMNGARTLRDYA
jgi:RNA polymerase primary sigma factor